MSEQRTSEELFPLDGVACQCFDPGQMSGCMCGDKEIALRAIAAGNYPRLMTFAEREWCRQEITRVEGYSEKDAEGADAAVARAVLGAWVDYCRDKGMML